VGSFKFRAQAFGLGLAALAALSLPSVQAEAGSQCGKASWYKMGSRTANGERMNANALAAAHRSLPFGTKVRVENLRNGRSVVVRINDRGPFVGGRVIDVTRGAAQQLGMIGSGVARVKVTVVEGRGKLSGSCS
jgi:rare lipoprotein A